MVKMFENSLTKCCPKVRSQFVACNCSASFIEKTYPRYRYDCSLFHVDTCDLKMYQTSSNSFAKKKNKVSK